MTRDPAFSKVIYHVNNIQDAWFPANVADNTEDNVQSSANGSGDTGAIAAAVKEMCETLVGETSSSTAIGEVALGENVQGIKSLTITGKASPGKSEATAYTANPTGTSGLTFTYAWTVAPAGPTFGDICRAPATVTFNGTASTAYTLTCVVTPSEGTSVTAEFVATTGA